MKNTNQKISMDNQAISEILCRAEDINAEPYQSPIDPEVTIHRTVCTISHCACGILAHMKDGRLIKVEGDTDFPQNEGAMCPKGLSMVKATYHPDRIIYPMKQMGERGSDQWEKISWDEALDTICSKIQEAIDEDGPLSIAYSFCDGFRGNELAGFGIMKAIGSPNVCGTDAHYCFRPQANADMTTFGEGNFITSEKCQGGPEFENSKVIMTWGANPFECHMTRGKELIKSLKNGGKLIVVDPRFTNLASKADIWLQPRPSTDGALALGMVNYAIENNLYDREFVEKYCAGFNELKERARQYPLKKVSEITWVPEELIKQATIMWMTTKPGSMTTRMGMNMHTNAMQSLRAANCLLALSGNIDIRGGNVLAIPIDDRPYVPFFKMEAQSRLDADTMDQAPGVKERPMYYGKNASIYARSHPPAYHDMLLTGKPHKIRVYICVNDPVGAMQDTKKIRDAIMNVDFVVKSDLWMSPTSRYADIVLPAANQFERDEVHTEFFTGYIRAVAKVKEPEGECKDEKWIFLNIAKRLGLKMPYPMDSVREFHNHVLGDTGLDFEEARKKLVIPVPYRYKKYEQPGYKFPTKSGKIELYSNRFKEYGYDPLPFYEEIKPEASERKLANYPLILITGARTGLYYHSYGRQLEWLRELFPWPTIELHPDTARNYGIGDGDWVYIETPQRSGRVKLKAEITYGIDPHVVHCRSHWWYPERKNDPDRGLTDSNINAVLSTNGPYDPISGSTIVRGGKCKITRVPDKEVGEEFKKWR